MRRSQNLMVVIAVVGVVLALCRARPEFGVYFLLVVAFSVIPAVLTWLRIAWCRGRGEAISGRESVGWFILMLMMSWWLSFIIIAWVLWGWLLAGF